MDVCVYVYVDEHVCLDTYLFGSHILINNNELNAKPNFEKTYFFFKINCASFELCDVFEDILSR